MSLILKFDKSHLSLVVMVEFLTLAVLVRVIVMLSHDLFDALLQALILF